MKSNSVTKKIIMLVVVLVLVLISWFAYKAYFAKPVAVVGKIIVATDATYPPLEYVDASGAYIGFDIDLAKSIAKDLNVDLEIKNISFDNIFDALKNGEVDMVISSITITPERQKEMSFSTPYLNAGQVLVARNDSKIFDITSLKNVKVGVQVDTTSFEEGEKYVEKTNLVVYPNYDKALLDLKLGKIEAIIIDYPAGVSMSQDKTNKVKVIGKPFTSEFYGIAISKDNKELLIKVNKAITNLKKSGRLDQMESSWFKR